MKYGALLAVVALTASAGGVFAGEADSLCRQGLELLRQATAGDDAKVVPAAGRLAEAAALYEKRQDDEGARKADACLYWCRKRMTARHVESFRKDADTATARRLTGITRPVDPARAADYSQRAEEFARGHPDEHLLIAVRFFEVADRFPQTSIGLKAMQRSFAAMQKVRLGGSLRAAPSPGSARAGGGAGPDDAGQGRPGSPASDGAELRSVVRTGLVGVEGAEANYVDRSERAGWLVGFMRLHDGKLDPSRCYESGWFGSQKRRDHSLRTREGMPVVGVYAATKKEGAPRAVGFLLGKFEKGRPQAAGAAAPERHGLPGSEPGRWDERLLEGLRGVVSSGLKPSFVDSSFRLAMKIDGIDADGDLRATGGGVTATYSLGSLALHEKKEIALSMVRLDPAARRHALAAFFLLASGDTEEAALHLSKAGDAAADVKKAFGM